MGTRAQKITKNIALKVAIIERELTQREVARRTDIPEVRLSLIVRGADPTDDEKRALAKALRRRQSELFPELTAVAS